MSTHYAIQRLAETIGEASFTAALTGAGVSTLSGIADFRSPGQEIWRRHDRERVFDIDVFRADPSCFHRFANDCLARIGALKPSAVHRLLARLESAGLLHSLATQNIDGLHQRAGSADVLELHGGIASGRCLGCGRVLDADATLAHLSAPPTPACDDCGGILKPDVVFYGEALPERALEAAWEAAERADLYLVFGSSLQVTPAAHLPLLASRSGARLVILNREPTAFDDLAWLVIRDDLRDVTAALGAALTDRLPAEGASENVPA